MADKVSEIKDPLTGEGLFWAYEAGSREAGGFDTYEEADKAYHDAKQLQSNTSRAINNALQSSGTSHGHRHKNF